MRVLLWNGQIVDVLDYAHHDLRREAMGRCVDTPTYPPTVFQSELARMNACPAGRTWVGTKTAIEAWYACENLEWLLWISGALRSEIGYPTTAAELREMADLPEELREL